MPKLNIETLNDDRLRKSVSPELYELGQALFQTGRVQVLDLKDDIANCVVQDKHPYRIQIKVAKNFLYLKCDCRYAYRGLVCEHDIAACLGVREMLQQRLPPTWRNQLRKVLDITAASQRKSRLSRYFLFFSLQQSSFYDFISWKISPVTLSASHTTRYLSELLDPTDQNAVDTWMENHQELLNHMRVPYQNLNPDGCLNLSSQEVFLANVLLDRSRSFGFYNSNFPLDDFLTVLSKEGSPVYFGETGTPIGHRLNIIDRPADFRLQLTQDLSGIHIKPNIVIDQRLIDIRPDQKSNIIVISQEPIWIILGSDLIKILDQSQFDLINNFLDSPELIIPSKDEVLFREKYLLSLAEKNNVVGDLVEWQTIAVEPVRRVYLSDAGESIQAELRFDYGGVEVIYDPNFPGETIDQEGDSWTLFRIQRKSELEKTTYDELTSPSFGLKRVPNPPQPGMLSLRARVHPVDFLMNHVPKLISNGYEVFGEEQLKTARVNRNVPTISFQISSGIDWFDVKAIVNFGELEVSLKEIRRALRKHEKFIKLSDGTIGALPEEWIDQYKYLFSLAKETEVGLRLSRQHIGLIDQVVQGGNQTITDKSFQDYRQKLLEFSGIKSMPLPKEFYGELRPYQIAGYNWLHYLREYEFSGCLADDMGLGKTIQALVFFQSLKECIELNPGNGVHNDNNGCKHASLIVVPRSLLVNWQREAHRFTPNLSILEFFDSNRTKDINVFDQYDLIITTYGILLRDISLFRKYQFDSILLDESQAIKNPLSQTARAARLLQSKHRLVLTGTPIENSTQELWSQFSFLNPGLLGNFDYFKKEFISPIEKKSDENAAQMLRRIVFPFILRRTKDQVAPELPPRTERILYCDMEPAQMKLYNRTRDYYRGMVLGMLDQEGINKTRFRILEGLLRLRQIANHPKLIDEKFRGESAKFELLVETIQTLQSEGHKALIFSQFVQMLRLVRNPLDDLKIPYVYLDGHTRNRMELVDAFQKNKKIPFFLISLKAGGQGLNLTAADYVIHIDPWWNPAVEMQASDRTHRIGQDKPVFIYKMITRDTVEEKILQLQERKRNLVDQIITTESSFFKSLTSEDIQLLFN